MRRGFYCWFSLIREMKLRRKFILLTHFKDWKSYQKYFHHRQVVLASVLLRRSYHEKKVAFKKWDQLDSKQKSMNQGCRHLYSTLCHNLKMLQLKGLRKWVELVWCMRKEDVRQSLEQSTSDNNYLMNQNSELNQKIKLLSKSHLQSNKRTMFLVCLFEVFYIWISVLRGHVILV